MGYKARQHRKVCFTIVAFALVMFMVLNLMMVQISQEGRQHDLINSVEDKILQRREIQPSKKSSTDEFHDYFVAQGQRKPKTTNFDKDEAYNDKDTYKYSSEGLDHTYYQDHDVGVGIVDKDQRDRLNGLRGNPPVRYRHNDLSNRNTLDDSLIFKKQSFEKIDNIQGIEDIEDIDQDYEDEEDDDNDDEENEDEVYNDDDNDGDNEDEKEEENNDVDDYDYDDKVTYKPNQPFKPGDFEDADEYNSFRKPKLQFEEVPSIFRHGGAKLPEKKLLQSLTGDVQEEPRMEIPVLVEDGIYWSPYVESLIPKGLSYRNITKLITSLRSQVVKKLEQPTWDKCGRPKNGYIVLGDSTTVCARYRQPHKAFVFGEVLSFYLSRLLGMDNVPAVILAKTNSTSRQWSAVNISSLEWEENKTIAFIQWIDNLNSGLRSKSYIPSLLLEAYRSGQPIRREDIIKHRLHQTDPAFLVDLVQWGTMIIFDYLTGNYDRVASMQDAAEKEDNPRIIQEAIRNLPKSSENDKLWLIDNESGLLDAYHLLQSPKRSSTRFTNFHREMLHTTCIFQSSLVKALLSLSDHPSPHSRLLNFAMSHEPLMDEIPKDKYYNLFVSLFQKRLNDVKEWILQCQNQETSL